MIAKSAENDVVLLIFGGDLSSVDQLYQVIDLHTKAGDLKDVKLTATIVQAIEVVAVTINDHISVYRVPRQP